MAMKKWVIGSPDKQRAKEMAEEFDIDPFAALIACVRGLDGSSELEFMLSDEPLLCDPRELKDIKTGADFINRAIDDGIKIAIFGDYDCDGVVATALLYDYLKGRGADVVPYIPDRINEGYGMNCAAVDKLNSMGVRLIITVDNGISCATEIEYANSLGISTVVTDHHIPPEKIPDAVAVIDPHRIDCPSQFKEICGCEVAFKLVCLLDDKEPEQLLPQYADMLAVATIGDVMPLVNENRSIVKAGIRKIQNSANVGIAAILNIAGIDRKSVNVSKISFGIVPRINAAGRMGDAFRAFKVLIADNALEALNIVGDIDDDNSLRQRTEGEISKEAIKIIEENGYYNNRVIVVEGKNWHMGVLGIVASRICERYGKPTVVLSLDGDGNAHGSGRSFSGFHLYNAINCCSNLLDKYGGHELAAGVSLRGTNIEDFRNAINEYALNAEYAVPKLNIDFCINPVGMTVDMAFAVRSLEPFGQGNPVPVFGILGATLDKIMPISSGKHLKLLFSKNGGAFQALLFGVTPDKFCFAVGDVLDLAVTLDANLYHDEYTLSVQIKALRLSGTDDDALFESKRAYEDFICDKEDDLSIVFPDRAQVGGIYKFISQQAVSEERLKYLFINDIGYARVNVAVTTLLELGLISKTGNMLSAKTPQQKTDLLNSKTYKYIYERVKNNE